MDRVHIHNARRPLRLAAGINQQRMVLNESVSQRIFQVVHDMQSPLSVLHIMARVCDELDEEKRSVLTNTVSQMQGMMEHLLDEYTNRNARVHNDELPKTILCSEFIDQILREKKYQYLHRPVSFEKTFSEQSQTVTIFVQPDLLRRAISNLINNAVDAIKDNDGGKVMINLTADGPNVKIGVKDNGSGMTATTLSKISKKIGFTAGKRNGHGLGMTQVWDMLENNSGNLVVQSELQKGTSFELIFPKA